jgi:hypothetical protein
MVNYVMITTEVRKPLTITCDVCGRSFDWGSLEAQEFLSIRQEGGFASVFGDGALVCLDICDGCLEKKLGKFINVR